LDGLDRDIHGRFVLERAPNRSAGARQITAISGEAVSHSSLSPDGNHVTFASTVAAC